MYHKVPCDMFLIVESDDNKISFLDSINIQSSAISSGLNHKNPSVQVIENSDRLEKYKILSTDTLIMI